MAKPRLFFRADGNSKIGLGHVIRSLALAELLQADFECTFAIQQPSEALLNQLQSVCKPIEKLAATENENQLLAEAETISNSFSGQEIIVLDGYQFSTGYQQILKAKGNILVCLDDLHDRYFVADAIINIAGGLKKEAYSVAPYTKLCLGPAYALLRKPFREAQKTLVKPGRKEPKMLLCFGGADPENYTLKYAQKLHEIKPELRLEIVTGSAYQNSESLQKFISGNPYAFWRKNLDAEAMAELMAECAVALCSASSVAYEYCAVNGMLFVEKTAENQADLYRYLITENLALPAEKIHEVLTGSGSKHLAKTLIRKQQEIFNGQAETNLQNLFSGLALQAGLRFRKVKTEDAELLFEWANDPEARKFSFNAEPIPYETHLKWLSGKLTNPQALLLLAEIQHKPAALLRFDLKEDIALISYQIGAEFRGKGLGHRVLQVGLPELKKYFPEITEAIGYVQPENVASVRAFEKAGFKNLGIDAKLKAYKFLTKL
ncbi:UDP-2,4-diacetamido-2,4,6-trideoxy-beta-L-altropyranose hydrolase [Adhaeribacter soli]|uniref:UDP-2,4-diacetamido-2,4, 6-trideoxy-beta-L-altropyranose hydrolase n=1 Tax=Adhaeribacter soli TaxID=2607655 RepID=A0A5N1J768_9BACT|nr:UDP-2,4-diacetamido-2,4,6-trideoxy-beta-L-altropyranose hydrolase [Adhaeribacter soli]KAA9345812.1 UDP-2,4-diacetamido-2,4,6-trideoxy-beta-L-altropyranose hydrolase [Adhaeribacter soli]